MEVPTIVLPPVQQIDTVEIPLPTADVPYYIPMVVPPSDLRDAEGAKPVETKEVPPAPRLNLPPLPPIPIPSSEVLVTAAAAAVTAVAATTLTQPIIESIKKKLQKFLQGKIDKWKQKQQKSPKDSLKS